MRPDRSDVSIFAAPAEFRAWLQSNHDSAAELWVGYYRKATGKTSMTYAEAVEEALCYGWIDGITFRIDDEVHTNRFTPRRKGSNWSAINIAKMADLEAAGRLHPSGRRAFEERDRRKDAIYSYERPPAQLPEGWARRFQAAAGAWEYWQSETPSYRRQVTHWVVSAKRPETRKRRFETVLADSAARRRVAPMRVSRDQSRSGA